MEWWNNGLEIGQSRESVLQQDENPGVPKFETESKIRDLSCFFYEKREPKENNAKCRLSLVRTFWILKKQFSPFEKMISPQSHRVHRERKIDYFCSVGEVPPEQKLQPFQGNGKALCFLSRSDGCLAVCCGLVCINRNKPPTCSKLAFLRVLCGSVVKRFKYF